MIDYTKIIYIYIFLRYLKRICEKNTFFLGESFFEKSKMDKNKCPKTGILKFNLRKNYFVTIIEFYGITTEKIIFTLLR